MLAMKFSKKDKAIVLFVSVLIGIMIILTATFVWPGFRKHPEYDTFFIIGVIIALFPPSSVDFLDRRWRRLADFKIPELIRDITEAQRTGMVFTRALEYLSKRDYGILTKDLRKTAAMISWGIPFNEAMEDFAKRIDTPLAYRTITLLNEVGVSGGRFHEILEDIQMHVRDIQELEGSRRRQTTPYVMIIYASIGVFLFVVAILFLTLFSQVKAIIASGAPFGMGINPELYYLWFFHLSIIESVVGGFLAGKLGEGALAAGLKHIFILLIASIIVFLFIIAPSL